MISRRSAASAPDIAGERGHVRVGAGVRVMFGALAGDDTREREQGEDDLQEREAVSFGDFGPVHEGFRVLQEG